MFERAFHFDVTTAFSLCRLCVLHRITGKVMEADGRAETTSWPFSP